jgi:hypothetical protein
MIAAQRALNRTTVQCCCVVFWAAFVLVGCSKKLSPGQATGGAAPSASVAARPLGQTRSALACRAPGTSFSLGPVEGSRALDVGDDAAPSPSGSKGEGESDVESLVDLPFGTTVGGVEWHAGGYVVAAVDARQAGSRAVLAFLDLNVARGSVLDLGRVYGDAEPPRVVLRGDSAFVVVPDTDAAGNSYRYGWVHGLDGRSKLEWLGSFEQQVDDSAVFALASTPGSITVAWDEVERASHQSHVRWASLDASGRRFAIVPGSNAATASASTTRKAERDRLVNSTGNDIDAEAPQLVAHGSGYWLSYLVAEPTKAKTAGARGSSNSRATPTSGEDDTRVIELGRRGIDVLPLDANGRPNGKPIHVAERTAHVVTFDIEATADGGAIVAYRDADATPGVEAQTIEVARVRPDGGVLRQHIDDERVGAGTPIVLVDPERGLGRGSAPSAWVAVSGSAGETRLVKIPEQGDAALELVEAPQLVGVEPMLWRGDSLLVVRHRARYVEFERMTCTLGANDPPAHTN